MAHLMQYRPGVIAGLFVAVMLLLIGSLVGQGILKSERDAYERGARTAIMHARCRGVLPSLAYLQRAFQAGEPQTCADVLKLEHAAAQS